VQNHMLRAAAAIAAIGFVAACEAPTPTVLNGVAPDVAAPSPDTLKQAPVAKREARQIVVQAGQSLSRIAAKYGMPQRTIIAANDLKPPHKIKIGQQLLIPSDAIVLFCIPHGARKNGYI
jgi:nucleoid-associated protein YgaU